jgi:hypothetical protein
MVAVAAAKSGFRRLRRPAVLRHRAVSMVAVTVAVTAVVMVAVMAAVMVAATPAVMAAITRQVCSRLLG